MPKAKREATPKPKAADTRPVNQRGQEWQAQKLTGNRGARRRATCPVVRRAGHE